MPDLIELDDVRKTHPMGEREVHALAGVSLRVARGDYLAVMGASGSGKTTLLHLIGCLDRPTSGSVRLDGTDLAGLGDDELSGLRSRRIGFVFQAFHLIPQLSVAENVELPLIYQGVDRTRRVERSRRMLESVGLGERWAHRPSELSGGECQRTAIARALVAEPDVLLADEPTGNLDSRTGDEIMEILAGLHGRGVTIVLVTHDPARAKRAQRLIEMRDGRIANQSVDAAGAGSPS
jgi:putative ABC transport system ATP-binding protein